MTEYINCSRFHTIFINDEHIKTDFGYNKLNIKYNNVSDVDRIEQSRKKHIGRN